MSTRNNRLRLMAFYVSERVAERIRRVAQESETSISAVVRVAVRRYLAEYKSPSAAEDTAVGSYIADEAATNKGPGGNLALTEAFRPSHPAREQAL